MILLKRTSFSDLHLAPSCSVLLHPRDERRTFTLSLLAVSISGASPLSPAFTGFQIVPRQSLDSRAAD